jgi:ubiquinone/menaquinone biosynthesis C-methylase UbiE
MLYNRASFTLFPGLLKGIQLEELQRLLREISPQKLLDVATGAGNSMSAALEMWPDCREFTGIDISDRGFEQARKLFSFDGRIGFREMSASSLDFPEETFDAVMILNSLHHLESPEDSVREMYRVLAPGGRLWIGEMYRDGQRPEQMTHVLAHHWWSKIDRLVGISHNETFARSDLLALVAPLGAVHVETLDNHGDNASAHDPEIVEHFEKAFESYREKYAVLPEKEDLDREGEELLRRVRDIGFAHASQLHLVIRR